MKVKAQVKLIHNWMEVEVPDSADPTEVAMAVLEIGADAAGYEGAVIDFDDENMESIGLMFGDDEVGDGC